MAFGERRQDRTSSRKEKNEHVKIMPGGGAEISWIPSNDAGTGQDSLFDDGRDKKPTRKAGKDRVEVFGAGMEKGRRRGEDGDSSGRSGRTKRRTNIRSGSRNTFRQM